MPDTYVTATGMAAGGSQGPHGRCRSDRIAHCAPDRFVGDASDSDDQGLPIGRIVGDQWGGTVHQQPLAAVKRISVASLKSFPALTRLLDSRWPRSRTDLASVQLVSTHSYQALIRKHHPTSEI